MKIAFNPSTVAALITPPNNKDITFDLRGRNIFARGVKFQGTDTWRDIKINNVSIGSNILDLRNGSNTTLTNTNGIVTINSTWRPVVDNLTSDSTTSSLSANQGRVLAGLINGKSDSEHNHDDRYLKLTGGTLTGNLIGTSAMFGGRFYGSGDDEGIIIKPSSNGYAGLTLGEHNGERSVFYFEKGNPFWRYNNGSTNLDIQHPKKSGTIALTSDIPDKNSWNYDDRYLKLTGGIMNGNARIGHGSGNLYIGNSGNDGWLAVQNICSQDSIGDGKWSIRVDGTASFQSIKFPSNGLIVQVSNGSNSPLKGIKLPDLGSNAIGLFSRVGNSSDEGGIVLSEDTCVIYNSFDTGWGLSVRDKDINQTGISGDNTIAFGVKADYRAYSLGGFEKSGSNNSYVLLGGGDHKLESALNVANADTVDGYHENSFLRYRGATSTDQEATLWSQIGIKKYTGALPDGLTGVYNYGSVISLPGDSSRFEIYASYISSSGNGLYYRSGWDSDKRTWLKFIDSSNIGSQTVASANKLTTARTIWGQSFDGTDNVNGTLSGVANIQFSADNTYNIGSNSAASKYIYTYWLGAKSGQKLELGANNSGLGQGLCIDTNLNVGIGTNTPSQKLDVHGNIRAIGNSYATHFYESSDKTLKKNIKSILSSTNIPKIREFDWKDTGEHSYGFIAQELEEQGYDCLVNEANGKKTVNYTATLALTVAKLQNLINIQNKKISNLTKELKALKYGRKKNS